jgi:sugar phosphate isomerase/epimerase
MPIDRGFVTNGSVPLADSIDAAGALDFDFVEIIMHGSGHRSELAPGPVRERLDDNGLDCLVHLPFSGIDVGSPHEHVRRGSIEEIEASLSVAGAIDARKAVLHPTSGADGDDCRRLMAEGVRAVDDAAREHGIEVCAENMFAKYVTVDDFGDVVADTDVSLTVDTGHARIEGHDAADTAAVIAEHRDRVSHLHLNDTRGRSDEHLPFGAGTLDFDTVFEPLREDWDGTLSLEVGTQNLDYIGHSKEHLDALIEAPI